VTLKSAFETYLLRRHGALLTDVEPTDTPGYWQFVIPCRGAAGGCYQPLHQTMGNEEPIHHTVSYFDPLKGPGGRFQARVITWRAARAGWPEVV
jgi:hypothetical protein